MPLTTYRNKRHFDQTAEPAGQRRGQKRSGWRFVVQKHDASHLHYDFRLEHAGVLKSWAVPRGPCLDPSQKRLAVQVEDHPIEYGGFEGTIPAGQYGGGTVLLWDRGTWQTDQDVEDAFRTGKLKFQLDGEKLKGSWSLVRMRPRAGEKRENWLLLKERDAEARPLSEVDILDDQPASVLSGRTVGEIAGNLPAPTQRKSTREKVAKKNRSRTGKPTRARRSSFPTNIEPQLATLVEKLPVGDQWMHEIKFDGYRILAHWNDGQVVLRTRNQNDWTGRFSELAQSISKLRVQQAVMDGEVVALLPNGASSFQELQTALSEKKTSHLVYYAFDLLYLDGADLRSLALEERKQLLAELVRAQADRRIQYSDHLQGDIPKLMTTACRQGLEGIVSKQRQAAYSSGRGQTWLKMKCVQNDEFVIGGFTDSTAARRALGALLVGYFDPDGNLIYAGKVGSGFSANSETDVRERLKSREQAQKSFDTAVTDEHKRTTHWVRPELVAQVRYSHWTDGGHLRHPVFQGLREDKPAQQVVRPQMGKTPKKLACETSTPRPIKQSPTRVRTRRISLSPAQQRSLQQIKLTHPERVVFPDVGLTKQDLVAYYAEVAPWMLPHVIDRPLSILRCPEGQGGTSFFQKHFGPGMPPALKTIMIQEKEEPEPYVTIHDLAGLLSLVQVGALEIHPWGSTNDDIEKPDRMIFDLDPDSSVRWTKVVEAAHEVRDRLRKLGLESFAKMTGGKGLHVIVPLQRRHTWPEVKKFSKAVAVQLAADSPSQYTASMSKAARHGRIYVDYVRNGRGATAVAPYSTRNRPGAPVAAPVTWKEVSAASDPSGFTVENISDRLASLRKDPWEDLRKTRQSLTAAAWRRIGER
ncbi:MAG: DNA ligase D [Planctomycetaceae bacterium]|nr:DNA ligase D [Planctomycetaceae bacterium]